MTAFAISNLPAPVTSLQRARLYAPDGSTVTDLALVESPAGVFSGSLLLPSTLLSGLYTYEVRQVSAQTGNAFDVSTIGTLNGGVVGTSASYGYLAADQEVVSFEGPILLYQNQTLDAAWNAKNGQGDPFDITGHLLSFVVHDSDSDTVQASLDHTSITLQPSDPSLPSMLDQALVSIPSSLSQALTPGKYAYKLWDLTAFRVIGEGSLMIQWAPLPPD